MDWALLSESAANGALVGLMYSLVAMGIVLIYKSSSVPNLAQGAMTMLGPTSCSHSPTMRARRYGSRSRWAS